MTLKRDTALKFVSFENSSIHHSLTLLVERPYIICLLYCILYCVLNESLKHCGLMLSDVISHARFWVWFHSFREDKNGL